MQTECFYVTSTDLYCCTKKKKKGPVSISSETGIACSSAEVSLGSFLYLEAELCGGEVMQCSAGGAEKEGWRSAYSCLLSSSLSPDREKLQLCLYPPSRLVSDLSRA